MRDIDTILMGQCSVYAIASNKLNILQSLLRGFVQIEQTVEIKPWFRNTEQLTIEKDMKPNLVALLLYLHLKWHIGQVKHISRHLDCLGLMNTLKVSR